MLSGPLGEDLACDLLDQGGDDLGGDGIGGIRQDLNGRGFFLGSTRGRRSNRGV